MGLADRDYMRDRARSRGTWAGGHPGRDAKAAGGGRGQHFQASQTGAKPLLGHSRARFLGPGLSFLLIALPMYSAFQREGWIPDFEEALPFPASGSVTVAQDLPRKRITSRLTITASRANAVVQLMDPNTGAHILSIYVGARDRVAVPVPAGTFRMRLIEGQKWHGQRRYFGSNTSFETVADLMTFTPRTALANSKTREEFDARWLARMNDPAALDAHGGGIYPPGNAPTRHWPGHLSSGAAAPAHGAT